MFIINEIGLWKQLSFTETQMISSITINVGWLKIKSISKFKHFKPI